MQWLQRSEKYFITVLLLVRVRIVRVHIIRVRTIVRMVFIDLGFFCQGHFLLKLCCNTRFFPSVQLGNLYLQCVCACEHMIQLQRDT